MGWDVGCFASYSAVIFSLSYVRVDLYPQTPVFLIHAPCPTCPPLSVLEGNESRDHAGHMSTVPIPGTHPLLKFRASENTRVGPLLSLFILLGR